MHVVMSSYIKSLESSDIHHVVASFWYDAHDLNCFLQHVNITM